jgi:hypothetical protein
MSIIAEGWAWDAAVNEPLHRLALVVLAEFADARHRVDIPMEAFTYYCLLHDRDVEPLLRLLAADEFIKLDEISRQSIRLSLLVRSYSEDGE